jgi:hypothetical protein
LVSGEQQQPSSVTVSGPLLRYLRRGVKQELAAIVTVLQIELDSVLDPETYCSALARFEEGSSLFDAIGLTDEAEPKDLELDLARWPRLVLKTLESEYDAELMRLQDSAAEGRDLPLRDVPALGSLLAEVREKCGLPPRPRRKQTRLGEATEPDGCRRSGGHG